MRLGVAMAEIRVTTEVEICDELGKPMLRVMQVATANPGGNPRFFADYTRSAIQTTEHGIADMLVAKWGDTDA
jgi:hypothetical protein